MHWKEETTKDGTVIQYVDSDTGQVVKSDEYERCMQIQRSLESSASNVAYNPLGHMNATTVATVLPTIVLMILAVGAILQKWYLPLRNLISRRRNY